jgi:hypothetical protein
VQRWESEERYPQGILIERIKKVIEQIEMSEASKSDQQPDISTQIQTRPDTTSSDIPSLQETPQTAENEAIPSLCIDVFESDKDTINVQGVTVIGNDNIIRNVKPIIDIPSALLKEGV